MVSNPKREGFIRSGGQWHVSELTAEVLVLAKAGFAPFLLQKVGGGLLDVYT